MHLHSPLPEKASTYVDGSFISKLDIPLVSPEESFDCPLGYVPWFSEMSLIGY